MVRRERQARFRPLGEAGQARVEAAHVTVVGVGALGLAGAALLGCGGSTPAGGGAGGGGRDAGAASGAPKNVKRAEGFDPKLGTFPVNNKNQGRHVHAQRQRHHA